MKSCVWASVPFEELVEFHDRHRIPLSKKERADRPGSFPYYGAQGIIDWVDDYIFDGRFLLIAEDGENLNSRKQPVAYMAEGQFWVNNHAHVVKAIEGVADDDFLRAYVEIHPLKGHITGAAQPKLSQASLKRLSVTAPPYPVQTEIGEAIRALDGLIDVNRRRIEILEEMARLLYREWFVHFRFPGHEGVELVDSDLGPIPEGWEVSRLVEVCSLVMGQSPKSEYYNDIGVGLPFHQGVTDFGPRFPIHAKWTTVDKRVAEPGDILFSVRAPVGRINVAPDRLVVGRGLSAIRDVDGNQNFLLVQLKDKFAEEDSIGGGTIFNAVTKRDMESILLLKPLISLVKSFEAAAAPMADLIANLSQKNILLREARDLLLPRLVSGELDVSELDFGLEALGA